MADIKLAGNHFKYLIYLLVVVLINLAGLTLFFRLDLTEDKTYSISPASQKVVSTLSDPLTINVFFTKNLPAPHNNTEQYLHDLLEEYAIYANRYFNYRFFNVSPDEGDLRPATRENQELAKSYGINPLQIQVIEEDEVKFQNAYMGLVLIHGDIIERIATITSIDGLEYQLTSAIMKLNNKVSALLNLSGKIQLKLYLSSSLIRVAPLIGLNQLSEIPDRLKKVVKTLNEKYFDRLAFEYLDPTANPGLIQKAKSNQYNLMNLEWPAVPNKNIEAGGGSIGLVMEYGENVSTIHLMRVLRLPIIGTRYELVDMDNMEEIIAKNLESLIDINEDLGYLADHGTPQLFAMPPVNPANQVPPEVLNNFRAIASQNYSLKNVNLKDEDIPGSLNSLIIAGPTEAFTEYELFQIDQFLMQGKSLVILLDKFNEIMPTRQMGLMGQGPQYIPVDTGLDKLLAHYGIGIKRSYVLDKNCFKQEIPPRLGGGQRPIYWAPLIQNRFIGKELSFMKNIKQLVAVKTSPLQLDQERVKKNGLKAYRLFASSQESWEMKDRINLNPMLIFPPKSSEEMQSFPLAYILEGEFSSYFGGKPLPVKKAAEEDAAEDSTQTGDSDKSDQIKQDDQKPAVEHSKIKSESDILTKGKPGKIFLMASADMLTDGVIDEQGRSLNAVFIMNLLDALNDREDIAVLRGKKQRFNPLTDTGALTKTMVKSFNIGGLPVLVVFFGLIVWGRRISRKKYIQLMFQK
jgi:ABC-type uncharacterized transport system involved in gliding motility auxiliary subunit